MAKTVDQLGRDSARKTYRLAFPSDLDPERVAGWLRTFSGTLRTNSLTKWLGGAPSIVLEIVATNEGIVHRLKVPHQYESRIVPPLISLVPGIRVDLDREYQPIIWKHAVEIGLKASHRPLRIYNPFDVSHHILTGFSHLADGEALIMQWVISPAQAEHKPEHGTARTRENSVMSYVTGATATRDEIKDRRDKLDDHNLMGVVRIAARANTVKRANHLVTTVVSSIKATGGASHQFYARLVTYQELQKRIDRAATPLLSPIQLGVPEMLALIGWPLGDPQMPGLPAAQSRRLAVPAAVGSTERVIGMSNFPGRERKVAISFPECRRHVWVGGGTGVGKSVLLGNMMRHDIAAGHGLVMLESKGDLFRRALDIIPRERLGDVIVLDLSDTNYPIGFNPLDQGDSRVAVDELVNVLKGAYGGGLWTDMVFRNGLQTINEQGLTIMDMPALLMPVTDRDVDWRDQVTRNVKDPDLQAFWQRINKEGKYKGEQISQASWDRLHLLAGRPEIRNILGQRQSTFKMDDVVRDKKILLVNLSGVPQASASIMGTLLFSSLWQSVKRIPTQADKSTFLYLDEFHHYMDMPVDLEQMLVEARSMGLGMVLAHQYLDQLTAKNMEEAIMANAGTKIAFQLSAKDARTIATNFGTTIAPEDIQRLGRYEAVARVSTDRGTSAPFTFNTLAPEPGYGLASQVRTGARAKYGRPIQQVQQDILNRRTAPQAPRKASKPFDEEGVWGNLGKS